MLLLIAQASTQAATQPAADGTTPWERIILSLIAAGLAAWLAYLSRGQKEQGKRIDTVDNWQRQTLRDMPGRPAAGDTGVPVFHHPPTPPATPTHSTEPTR